MKLKITEVRNFWHKPGRTKPSNSRKTSTYIGATITVTFSFDHPDMSDRKLEFPSTTNSSIETKKETLEALVGMEIEVEHLRLRNFQLESIVGRLFSV